MRGVAVRWSLRQPRGFNRPGAIVAIRKPVASRRDRGGGGHTARRRCSEDEVARVEAEADAVELDL
jgi:hypothetical protein